ncbi:MAG: hypothetical protein LKI24_13560 [Acidipropionibacterium sp.]|jgi:hypothetical protein|nr:hypothetical protein [Acidipropionibacterium sp.]
MAAVPSDQAGAGSAINDTARQLGGALGTAVMGSVLSSQFASRVTTGWTPWRLPDAAMAIARGSLGAAQAVAGRCPEPIRGPLIRAANLAYVDAMHLATWTGIGAALLSAVVALVLFPSHQHRKTARPDGPGGGTPAGARRDLRRPARTTGAS